MKTKSIISNLILIATILLFAYYIYKNIDTFKSLTIVNPLAILLLAVIFFITIFTNGLLLDALMIPFGIRLSKKEKIGLPIVTNFYNFITPFRGGMAARAVYLKKKYNFAYVHFLATLAGIYILIFLVGSLAGLVSMFAIYSYYKIFNLIIFILFLAVFVFMIGIIALSPELKERKNKWLNRFIKVINGWNLIKKNKKVVLLTILISLVQLILGAVATLVTYHIFGIPVGFFKSLFIASVGSLSILVAITPGNLGVGDAISVFSAAVIGISLTNAVAATILGRAVNLVIIFISGPIFSYYLFKNMNKQHGK